MNRTGDVVIEAGPHVLRGWIERGATQTPDKPFIISIDDGRQITYAQLHRLARQIGACLSARGFKASDRVALLANNSIEHLACFFGVLAYGATICTIHVEMNRRYLGRAVEALRPRLVVLEDGLGLDDVIAGVTAERLPLGTFDGDEEGTFFAAARRFAPDSSDLADAGARDDAVILFTSGTSAWPKGVVQTYREMLCNVMATAEGFAVGEGDRIYDYRSYNWASAQLLSALVPLCAGATCVMTKKFSASRFFQHVRDFRATIAAGNPTTVNMLLNTHEADAARDLPALRFLTSSSAPLVLEEWRRFEERFGIRIAQGYGSSESGWIAAQPGESRKFGTVGRPLPYHDVAVVDANGGRLPQGEIGAVELGGFPDVVYRYVAEDGSIKVQGTGRMRTGDLGLFDADGYLCITGREKDLIIRGGVNISPLEIDGILMQRPDIVEAATIGIPDRVWGEEVVAYVVARAGTAVTGADILAYCGTLLPAFKAPKRIVFTSELPKTERGKLDRKALVEAFARETAEAG